VGAAVTDLVARLVVHFDVSQTTQNARKHWTGIHRSNKRAKLAAGEAWILAGMPRCNFPVEVRLINCRTRTMDEFNFGGACKGIIDGLFKDRITPDDSPEWVRFLPVEQRPHKSHRTDPTVIVEVYRRENAEVRA
jgi:hypothetical protein